MTDRERRDTWHHDAPEGLLTSGQLFVTPRLGDRYEVLGMLGSGGMGTVYRVRDIELDEIVALKLLRRDRMSVPGMLARFRQEVKLARRITHPNVVRTFDLGEVGEDRYITMEYVEGTSLASVLAATGPLPIGRALAIARGICAGAAAAHRAGVLHRDLKPDNVLLAPTPDGERAAVTDFGIARVEGAGTTHGTVVGTPAYMAPEQVRGHHVDARADLYAIGAILYEMVTGRRAWTGEQPYAVAIARLQRPPPDPRALAPVPDALAAIVLRAMAPEPADRFPTADAMAEALSMSGPTTLGPIAPLIVGDMPVPSAQAVAVLPFRAGSEADAHLADGLTDEIIDSLSMTSGLRVRPRGAVSGAAEGRSDPREIGRILEVGAVVDGSVRRVKDKLRITARLVTVQDGFQLWAQRFECVEDELLVVSDEVARAIAGVLDVTLEPAVRAPAAKSVVDLYLRARQLMREQWDQDLSEVITILDEALAIAPVDPNLLATFAMARARQAFYAGDETSLTAVQALAQAQVAAEQAVALGGQVPDAWLALAHVRLYARDVPAAARALAVAVGRAPGLARAQHMLGNILLEAGQVEQGLDRLSAAIAVDPTLPQALNDRTRALAYLGRHEEVLAQLAQIRASHSHTFPGRFAWVANALRVYGWLGRFDLAREIELPEDIPPFWRPFAEIWRHVLTGRDIAPLVAGIVEPIGQQGSVLRLARRQTIAELLAHGRHPSAIEQVARAVEEGLQDHTWMERCPALDPLRADPRWQPLADVVAARARQVLAALET